MNKELKRKLYAIALAGIILTVPKTRAYADEIDSSPIDIDKAISELVPGYEEIDSNNKSNDITNENSSSQECYHLYEEYPDNIINFHSPSCEYPGMYDAVYHCVKCGNAKIVREYLNSYGHDLGEEFIENSDNYGYDIVRKCQNPDCDYAEVEKIKYLESEPISNSDRIKNENKEQGNNKNLKVAAISLGVFGGSV